MSFNIIEASKKINDKYIGYLKTVFDIDDKEYKKHFLEKLEKEGTFSKGPYLDVIDSFKKGKTIEELINEGLLSSDFNSIARYKDTRLYLHQELALRKISDKKNVVVSTGTGSGKTECFLLPIINALMKEKEANGKLTPGVRALLVYPMNALANDQISRLRNILEKYPDITFGCYTGQTEHQKDRALSLYKQLNRTEDNPDPKPLKNELLSRDEMKETPPHILVSNYAMLEYLILRPDDSVFFDGPFSNSWRFIVLDEAHTYVGSTGIEVSMLLRRLRAKIRMQELQYILTSATLGSTDEQNPKVVQFAENLCNAKFKEEDIIRAVRVNLNEEKTVVDLNLDFSYYSSINEKLVKGYDYKYILDSLEENSKYNDLQVYLYDLLLRDKTYWKIKDFLSSPKSVEDICKYMNCSSTELSDFVNVASLANKNGSKLFDSRYHFFIKATEGFYITLSPTKEVFLQKQNYATINNEQYKVFEAVTCKHCHTLYLLGNIINDHLEQKSFATDDTINEAFLIGSKVNDTDDDNTLEDEDLEVETYELCPHCGFIRKANLVHKDCCEHNEKEFIKLIKVKNSKATGKVTKCVACEGINRLGVLRGFFTGQEATTSVIGTSLFEQLPSHENKIVIHNQSFDEFDFGIDTSEETVEKVLKAKQFIAFSDSRQAAAYYASYFSSSYDFLLYSKIVRDGIKKLDENGEFIPTFINSLISTFKNNEIHPILDKSPDYDTEAWKAVLKELVDCRGRNSLIGLGLMDVTIDNTNISAFAKYKLTKEDFTNLLNVYILQMLNDTAFSHKSMNENDISFFTHNCIENVYQVKSVTSKKYEKSFIPKNANKSNKRIDYIKKVLAKKGITVDDDELERFLNAIWKLLTSLKLIELKNNKTNGYVVNLNKLKVRNSKKWYICKKCKRLTTYNIDNVCPNYHCDGDLEEVDPNVLFKDNHYYQTFETLEINPLRVVEHTAQLNRKKAYEYQSLFTHQQIDVLSCSTTFEMGVDVGNLETVFMRNMPPSPTNYSQRAGRAGRSTNSAAFALTFCNKSNHDFNFYNNPVDMIKGVIEPPMFKTDNEKICIRHLYSSALAFFWRNKPMYFRDAQTMLEPNEFGLGYDLFKQYLESKPEDLKHYLLNSIPDSLIDKFGIEDFKWVDWLFDDPQDVYPNLKTVFELYKQEIDTLNNEKDRLHAQNKPDYSILKRLKNYREEDIISFFSKNNILPKYGFPVDTVELKVPDEVGLELSRDLSMAISEYAPGCQIVANGKLITSRFIKTVPGKGWKLYDYVQCPECKTLNMELHLDSNDYSITHCKHCHTPFSQNQINTFLIPEFGFIADSKMSTPTLIKPEKTYRSEVSFVGYKNELSNDSYQIGTADVNVVTAANGELAVLNNSEFYVCPYCGYAEEKKSNGRKLKFKEEVHNNDKGHQCTNKFLQTYSLGYKFETDVIKINPNIYIDYAEAYSILQALILASCRVLNIDNHEIEGCLDYEIIDHKASYTFILYDKTPGGAGHVKRLNSQENLEKVFKCAYDIANKCTCGGTEGESSCYNCLRTYQNQKHHDIIMRKYVIDYFRSMFDF